MSQPENCKDRYIPVIILILLLVAFYDVTFLNKTFKVTTANSQAVPTGAYGQADNKPKFIPVNGTDTPVMEEPVYQFIKNNLRQGILPFWNPHQACGYPLIGMLEIGLFYPLTFIMYLFPDMYAWDLLILSRFFLAGLFTFWFMRRLRFSILPSLCSAIVFMLSGPMVLLQYWTVNVDLLLPLILIAMERLIRGPDIKNMIFLTIAVALTIFAGHPEHIFLVNTYAFVFLTYRIFSQKNSDWQKIGKFTFAAYGLALGLSAIVFFPFLQNFLLEAWHNHPPGTGLVMEEQRDRALTLALPHFFQAVNLTFQWSFAGWWGGYLGTLPLGLSFMSLFSNQRRGLNYFFAAMTFILLGKAYGLPIINWLGYLPLFNACRYAIHTPHLVAFSVAVLSGMGLRTILSKRDVFQKGIIYCIILITIVALHLVLAKNLNMALAIKASLFAASLLIIFQTVLFLKDRGVLKRQTVALILTFLVFGELFLYIHRERPHRFVSFPKVPYIELLKSEPEHIRSYGIFWAFYPNTATGFGVDDLGYFFSLAPKRFVHFVNTLLIKDHFRNDFRPPALRAIPIEGKSDLLDLLNVKYMIAPDNEWLSKSLSNFHRNTPENNSVYSNEVNMFKRDGYFPRAFIVHKAVPIDDDEKSLMLISRVGPQLRRIAIINGMLSANVSLEVRDTPLIDRSDANINKYTANEVAIKANMENAGFLVLSDAYHPDWKAYVDGNPTKIYQTDYLLRSIFLPAGEHEVKFVFVPQWFYIGGAVSLIALLSLILLWNLPKKENSAL